jgi:signal transduction histidine kinase
MLNVGRRVLVVDDDTILAEMVSRLLEMHQYQVSVVHEGHAAIEKVMVESPELILLDLHLPDISGQEVLSKVNQINEDTVTIILTGFGGEQVAVELMKAGAIDFISKPFDNEVLLSAVESAFRLRDARMESKELKSHSSLEKFFPFLAHELRSPLHAIKGALEIIERRLNLDEKSHLAKPIEIINEEVDHLDGFVQECLDFVRPPNQSHFAKVQVNDVILSALNIVSQMFNQILPKIKITTNLDPKLPGVDANYEEIKRAFVNIIRNGFEAMPDGGEFIVKTELRSSPAPESLRIVFLDNGRGIKKENMKYLFQPFSTNKVKGTGLGLALCRRIIVERHRGEINIESVEEKGTTVTVILPIIRKMQISEEKSL